MTTPITSFSGEFEFLSNFSAHDVIAGFEAIRYPTVEHAFQAMKTMDIDFRRRIAAAETPGKAKRLGRKVELRPDWESVKLNMMHDLLIDKFLTHPSIAKELILTGDAELIEGNTWGDTFWGVCDGVGENHLGKLLMIVREKLKKWNTVKFKETP